MTTSGGFEGHDQGTESWIPVHIALFADNATFDAHVVFTAEMDMRGNNNSTIALDDIVFGELNDASQCNDQGKRT